MIFLEPNTVNVEIFELSQIKQNYSDDFIFKVKNEQNEVLFWFTGTNTSVARERYDRFNIEMVNEGDEDYANAKIFLNRGQFTFEAYKYNGGPLDENGVDGDLLETGKIVVAFEEKGNYQTNDIYS